MSFIMLFARDFPLQYSYLGGLAPSHSFPNSVKVLVIDHTGLKYSFYNLPNKAQQTSLDREMKLSVGFPVVCKAMAGECLLNLHNRRSESVLGIM